MENRKPIPTTPVVVLFLKSITSFAKFLATNLAVSSSGGAPSASASAFDVCEPRLEVPWQMPCVGAPLTQKSTGLGLPRALQLDAQAPAFGHQCEPCTHMQSVWAPGTALAAPVQWGLAFLILPVQSLAQKSSQSQDPSSPSAPTLSSVSPSGQRSADGTASTHGAYPPASGS